MIAILGGLGAAIAFATATVCSSRSARMIGARPALAWVMIVGMVALALPLAAGPAPEGVSAATLGWLAVGGAGNLAGLLLTYHALRRGKVGIVAPIVSTEGAIAGVLALLAGEPLSAGVVMALTVIAAGVFLSASPTAGAPGPDAPGADAARVDASAAAAPAAEQDGRPAGAGLTAILALSAALVFGVSLYAIGRISADLPVAWILLPARLFGIAVIALPLLAMRSLRLTRAAFWLVLVGGLCEVLGYASFTLGARHGIAVTAVLASQFAALSALAAFALFGERLARIQLVGVAAIVSGVAVLSALQA